jgi:ketosteroid isomerase-like protein
MNTSQAVSAAHSAEDTQKAAEDFARRFFAAYDAHNVAVASTLLAADMKIVAFDARERTASALLQDISAASGKSPPERELRDFEVIDAGAVIVVAFDNRVTSQKEGEAPTSLRYRESWVLKPIAGGLRAIWATYSVDGAQPDPHYLQPSPDAAARTGIAAGDQPAANFIARFFDAYIGRRPAEMKALFLPGSKFVFPNAQETSIEAMAQQQAGPEPPQPFPRPKNGGHFLDHFEVLHAGPVMVVAFDNHVTDWRHGHPEREEHTFRESWVIKQTPSGLRDVWVAMSLYGSVPPAEGAAEK